MELKTITDFDFGVGAAIGVSERVSKAPNDVTKLDENFILWLLLEQEFRVSTKVLPSRTYHDGNADDDDEDDADDDDGGGQERSNNEPSSRVVFQRLDSATERIARKCAEESLREAGIDGLLDDLSDEDRSQLLLQFYRSTELLQGDSISSVSQIFQALRSASKFDTHFSITQQLGEGRYGEVFFVRVKENLNERYAVKKISVTFESLKEDVQMAINESNILKCLKGHRNIVELHDFWLELEQSHYGDTPDIAHYNADGEECVERLKFYIQLELCSSSLQTWKEENHNRNIKLEKQQILKIAKDIFSGLAYIHSNNILHLDINPRNIVWANPECSHLKIVDFGLAVSGLFCNERRGTPGYTAPEKLLTSKSDIYSASVTIIEVARTVFTNSELEQIICSKIPGVGIVDLELMLRHSLDDNPAHRPSADTMINILS